MPLVKAVKADPKQASFLHDYLNFFHFSCNSILFVECFMINTLLVYFMLVVVCFFDLSKVSSAEFLILYLDEVDGCL